MGEANGACYTYRKQFGDQMNSYRCKFCKGYHIGHIPAKVKQALSHKHRDTDLRKIFEG